jgi:cytochrome c1
MTDPAKVERETGGFYVIFYLIIFTVLAYLLYREFKKDLH